MSLHLRLIPVLAATTWLGAAALAHAQPDLVVRLKGPASAAPGSDVGRQLEIVVGNAGSAPAAGTLSAGRKGYMIDIVLVRKTMPAGFATFSPQYFDGVLLRGGRVSRTKDLAPGDKTVYRTGAVLPADTPAGRYRLCARVDPGRVVTEPDEKNNTACIALTVKRLQAVRGIRRLMPLFKGNLPDLEVVTPDTLKPLPDPVAPGKPMAGGEAERQVLADGTLVIRFEDGWVQRLRPDGQIELVDPEGRVSVPKALQVQPATMPPLPGELEDWGSALGDQLLEVLNNLLSEEEMPAYLQTESDKDYYEVIDWRLRSILFLTAIE
jgi:hypothetical protein